jgi:hypothetical protein
MSKDKSKKRLSLLPRIKNFFFPKNFKQEMFRGMYMSSPYGCGNVLFNLLFGLGKLIRRAIDPGHKMFRQGKEKDGSTRT